MIFKMSAGMFLVGGIIFILTSGICFIFKLDPAEWLLATVVGLVITGGLGILCAMAYMILVK